MHNTIDIDPDVPIHRIFRLWQFHRLIEHHQLVLVKPEVWEDPFERLLTLVMIQEENNPNQISLAEHLLPVYAQCWSATGNSDTLLRAYSRVVLDPIHKRNTCPSDEGVKVTSTPRKLLQAVAKTNSEESIGATFLGTVKYMRDQQIQQDIANDIGRAGLRAYDDRDTLARACMKKRVEFHHEDEVRLIHIQERKDGISKTMTFNVDPSEFVDEVMFDPRLISFERIEREQEAKRLGFVGQCAPDHLYQGRLTLVGVRTLPK